MIIETKGAVVGLSIAGAAIVAELAMVVQALRDGVTLSPGELVMIATNVVVVAGAFFTLRSQVSSNDKRINKLELDQQSKISKDIADLIVAPLASKLDALNARMEHQDEELKLLRARQHEMANDLLGRSLTSAVDAREGLHRGRTPPRGVPRTDPGGEGGTR